jgi:hypothetical protein
MFPNFCGAMGLAGWLVVVVVWTAVVAVVVWAITRLFPDQRHVRPGHRDREDSLRR